MSVLPAPLDLATLITRLNGLLEVHPGAPGEDQLREACNVLYSSSLLKEEGRPVRARVILAPPDAFSSAEGPPDGTHAVRFTTSHPFTTNEIKRLSPAASFFHSVVAVWPGRDGSFRIWGVLNTGPRWMNLVAGGRKPSGAEIPYPIIHVRDPGWLLFYQGYQLLAEWRGREINGPRLDVFHSKLLNDRFAPHRRGLVEEVLNCCLPSTMGLEDYSELARLISLQFIRRVINLVRTSGHGGSVVFLPEGEAGLDAATRWIDCKYTAEADDAGLRYRHLMQSIILRVGELAPEGSTAEQAWEIFRSSADEQLDQLEEAFFELARFLSDLMQVDGVLVLDRKVRVIGFGGEIRVDRNVFQVSQSLDLEATQLADWNVQGDGTRHRSVYRLCSVEPEVIGFVISQDSNVRLIVNVDDSVVFWMHSVV
ncbi:putative sensor domain DACNV-containing protein [Luteolibacter luteus]|uniref:Probable sensor domain-containing protein n=1 Tax=Luteolibacter luteus TaxID=2728835 RepID=A0A858RQ10_9BACT|nr:hypothetical protein [Luteolibacter luteus]QJE98604.1 hypothetical protein HHL09_23410 [Luteolibacter luteus]